MLCLMWNAPQRGRWIGTYQEFARATGLPWELAPGVVDELGRKTSRVTIRNNEVTLENRRMLREDSHYKLASERQARFRRNANSNRTVTAKTLDVRRQTLDNVNNKHQEEAPRRLAFIKPSVEEIRAYCKDKSFALDAQLFWDHYEANGWRVGRNPMKNWRAAIGTWMRSEYRKDGTNAPHDSEGISTYAAIARANREAQKLRKNETPPTTVPPGV